jgi:tetratricopeptide (TPR) repeat protein
MMVSHLLGMEELDKDLEELVLEKTEGIPFFIEELISSLKDQGIIEKKEDKYHLAKDIRDVAVPSTIQDVIMARVDSLPDRAKGLLQTGSVAGREFSHDLVTDLSEEELWSHLSVLKDSELLYERGIYPQSAYVFKHALTQEVAYNTLLHKRRRETHEKIGKAMEQIYADRLEEFYEILAYHSIQGEDWQRAYSYSLKAGLRPLFLSAYEEAQRYFEAALGAVKKLPDTRARIEQEIDLRFNMRSALFPLGRHDDWADYVRAAEALAKEIGDGARLAKAYNYLSTHLWINGRHREAIELCEEGLRLAEAAGDFSVQIITMFHLGVPLLWMGEYKRHAELHRKVAQTLSGAAAFETHGLAGVPSVLARSGLAWGLAEIGEFEEAEAWGQEGIEIAEQVKNVFSSTWVYACLALAYLRSGKLDQAIELLQKTLALIRDAKVKTWFSFSAGSLGHAHLLMGRPDLALPILDEAVKPQNLNVSAVSSIYPITELAEAYRLDGQIERATERAEEALAIFRRTGERGFGAWALYTMAKIQASQGTGQMEQAIHSYHQAIDQAAELKMRPLLAHCHLGLGQLYLGNGRIEEARAEIEAAVDLYRSMDMGFWLPHAEAALAEISGRTRP